MGGYISANQFEILKKAYQRGFVVWKDFYRVYGSRSSAYRGMKNMVAKRLLKPVPHPRDRTRYYITDLGRAVYIYILNHYIK